MFLPHIAARQRAEESQLPAADAVSPIPIVISRQNHPRIDRGSSLQVQHGESWFSFSYHDNAADAVAAFQRPMHGVVGPEFWRVLCHELDLVEFQPVAIRQPAEVWT